MSDKFDIENQGDITQPTLVLCEGKRDASFVFHLAEHRGIQGIQIGFPTKDTAGAFGKDNFGRHLVGLRTKRGFQSLQHVVIMCDADADPQASFNAVCEQIRTAGQYSVPITANEEVPGPPGMTIRLIPDAASPGNLDLLLLRAIDTAHPLTHCFDPYFACCGLGDLPIGVAAKVRLTTIIAAVCHKNPSTSLAFVWSQRGNPIPLQSQEFDDLARFLKGYGVPLENHAAT